MNRPDRIRMVLCREAVDQVERYSLQLHSLQISVFSWPHTPGVSTSSCPRSCASTAAGNALGNARMSANNRCIMNAARTLAWVENSAFPRTKINGLPEAVSTSPPLHRDEHRFDLVHVAKYRKLPVVSKELSQDLWSSSNRRTTSLESGLSPGSSFHVNCCFMYCPVLAVLY